MTKATQAQAESKLLQGTLRMWDLFYPHRLSQNRKTELRILTSHDNRHYRRIIAALTMGEIDGDGH